MTLRLLDRLATLARADAHGVLDALEERSLLLRQHLRDAELALARRRARLEGLAREEERLVETLRRLLPRRRERDARAAALADVGEERARGAERLAAEERAFEELRARVRARLAAGAQEGDGDERLGPGLADDEEVEIELLRRARAAGGEPR